MLPLSGVIARPQTTFDGPSHTYGIEGWADEDVVGISSAAKVGQALEAFSIGSAWGFRLGYEGTFELLHDEHDGEAWVSPNHLRQKLQDRGLTPWATRDAAADRGTWVHDVLEALAQENRVPQLSEFSDEVRGHVQSLLGWYVQYRPSFVATEVQVVSATHGFAGRYDIRATIAARKLQHLFAGHESTSARRISALTALGAHGDALCLIDLKTSKGIYPMTHFPQLGLYETASVEIGFPVTDCQLVLNTKPDGSPAVLGASWIEPSDALVFVQAYRAIRRIEAGDPEEKLRKAREEAILEAVATPERFGQTEGVWARELTHLPILDGLDGKAIGRILGKLRKRGLVEQDERKRWQLV